MSIEYNPPFSSDSLVPLSMSERIFKRNKILSAAMAVTVLALVPACNSEAAPKEPVHTATTPISPEAPVISPTTPETKEPATTNEGLSNPATKKRAERVISTFENSTTEIQYDYAEDINDGRGITAGRAGFTSGTHDLLVVVGQYMQDTKNPKNALAKYVAPLKAVDGTESTKGLDGFVEAWKVTSNSDPALNKAQDKVYDEMYFNPAMERAKAAGVNSSVGQLIILDTIIQHGEGDDIDGLPAILEQATTANGTPENAAAEAVWLDKFLTIRRKHLEHAADPATRKAWQESVSRVDALRSILNSNNPDLTPPLRWSVYGDPFSLES